MYVSALYNLIIPILLVIILGETIFAGKSRIKLQFAVYYLPFILWILLSSFWSVHPEVTFKRAIYFAFLVIGMESLSHYVPNSTRALLKVFLPTTVIVVTVSILSLITGFPPDYWSGGNGLGLKGFATHQNMLGSLLFVFSSILNYKLFNLYYEKGLKNKVFWLSFGLNLLALLLLIITFSRSAILAYILFMIVFGLFTLGIKKTTGLITLFLIVLLIFSKVEPINKFISYTIYKGSDDILGSRSVMYKASLSAAKNGGLIGLGYGISDTSITKGVPGNEMNGIFIREKGSTVLGLIEEAGLVGLVLFYLPVGMVIVKAVSRKRDKGQGTRGKEEGSEKEKKRIWDLGIKNYDVGSTIDEGSSTGSAVRLNSPQALLTTGPLGMNSAANEKKFLIAIIIAMIVHSQFEAWGIGVGSVLLPLYLLFLARLFDMAK